MTQVVITGSTRGIGFGLADAFLARGCQVTINGRTAESVAPATAALAHKHGPQRLLGQPGRVENLAEVEALWAAAQDRFGPIDIWINNAGIAHVVKPIWDLPPDTVAALVQANTLGALYGARVAVRGMLAQGHGHFYNMEGFGSNGSYRYGQSLYGMSKYALHYLTQALVMETKGTPVKVSAISPGMVITDLLTGAFDDDPAGLESAKRIFNILADKTETVSPWLADKILANDRTGSTINWLTRRKILWRFLSAPFSKRDLFAVPAGDAQP